MMDENDDWFNLNEITDGIWFITDKTGVNCYLIEGTVKSLLIDTGWGLGNLAELVQSLTSLPIDVVFTHGHPDHVNGAFQFTNLYITPEDEELLNNFYNKETRQQLMENRFKNTILPPSFIKNDWINAEITDTTLIQEGYVFNLGKRKIEVIECPGHTAGSICLLDEEDELLFSGDSILSKPVLMNLETSLPLSTYLLSMKHVHYFSDKFNTILSGHDESPIHATVLVELINGVNNILEGKIIGTLKKTRFGEALMCKFDNTAVMYHEDNL